MKPHLDQRTKEERDRRHGRQKKEDHALNLANRLYNSIKKSAEKNPGLMVDRNDGKPPYCVAVFFPAGGHNVPVLKVIIRKPLPKGNSPEERSHKAICLRFGPQELDMYSDGKQSELCQLESLIDLYLITYGTAHVDLVHFVNLSPGNFNLSVTSI